MDKQEISLLKSKFDELAHVDESGVEYWSAREIMTLFGYNRWENFYNAITKALTSIQNAQTDVKYHLREVTKMLTLDKNATRSVKDFELTMLGERGIKPENLPPAEDIKKVERRVKSNEKKLAKDSCFKSEYVLVDAEKQDE